MSQKRYLTDEERKKRFKARRREIQKKYWSTPRGKIYRQAYQKKYNPWYRYGTTLEQIDKTLIIQNHKCAICKKELKEIKKNIDHSHITGIFRGILCSRCNIGLGYIEDTSFIQNIGIYLKT